MEYVSYAIDCTEDRGEILMAFLADMGFESFVYESGALNCYILDKELSIYSDEISHYLTSEGVTYQVNKIVTENWNSVWESNFEAITIGSKLCVRAPFHEKSSCDAEIVIMPKMSFGTGHHATTYQMLEAMMEVDFAGKRVVDMGCGSAILAIFAALSGAANVDAVDIDEWAVNNSIENIDSNGFSDKISVSLGDVTSIKGRQYDIVLANINRNILLRDMSQYVDTLSNGGELLISGFLEIDTAQIALHAQFLGLSLTGRRIKDGWVQLQFRLCI